MYDEQILITLEILFNTFFDAKFQSILILALTVYSP